MDFLFFFLVDFFRVNNVFPTFKYLNCKRSFFFSFFKFTLTIIFLCSCRPPPPPFLHNPSHSTKPSVHLLFHSVIFPTYTLSSLQFCVVSYLEWANVSHLPKKKSILLFSYKFLSSKSHWCWQEESIDARKHGLHFLLLWHVWLRRLFLFIGNTEQRNVEDSYIFNDFKSLENQSFSYNHFWEIGVKKPKENK